MRTRTITQGSPIAGGKAASSAKSAASQRITVNHASIAELGDIVEQFSGAPKADGFSVQGELQFHFNRKETDRQVRLLSTETAFLFHAMEFGISYKNETDSEVSGDAMRQAIENYRYQLRRKPARIGAS